MSTTSTINTADVLRDGFSGDVLRPGPVHRHLALLADVLGDREAAAAHRPRPWRRPGRSARPP